MKCKQARTLISRKIDGELSDAERRSLEQHTATCDECRVYYAELVDACVILQAHLNLTVSEAFDARVLGVLSSDRVEDTPSDFRMLPDVLIDFFRPAWRQVAGAAAISLLLIGMILVKAAPMMINPSMFIPQDRISLDRAYELTLPTSPSDQESKPENSGKKKSEGTNKWLDAAHIS